jgi:cytochrome c oxidase subunit 3
MTLDHPPGTPRPVSLDAGRFALWVFLATEVMFFTALIASYLVLRAGAVARDGMPWPRASEVHVDPLIGLINTFILIASSGCAMVACRLLAGGSTRGATVAVALSFVLGCAFLGVKGYEYHSKYHHGLLPGRIGELHPVGTQARARYDQAAGLVFLDNVKARLEPETRPLIKSSANSTVASVAESSLMSDLDPAQTLCVELLKDLDQRKLGPGAVAEKVYAIQAASEADPTRFHIHLPAVAPHGNLWASCYFLITGCHALHLIIGLVFLLGILMNGMFGRLNSSSLPYLSNVSLYWHFVDLVWLVVFPLIYLV